MLRPIRRSLLPIALFGQCVLAHAEPSVSDVDAAIKAGQYIQAEQLVKEAAPNHPGSPRIHYMLAQVLSRLPGREEEARQEYQQAMRLNPQLPFADTIEINALQERLRLNEPAHPPEAMPQAPMQLQQAPAPSATQQAPLPPGPKVVPFRPHLQQPQLGLYDRGMLFIQENNIAVAAVVGVLAVVLIGWSFVGRKKNGDGSRKKKDRKSSRRREPTVPADEAGQEAETFEYRDGVAPQHDSAERRDVPGEWTPQHQHDDERDEFVR